MKRLLLIPMLLMLSGCMTANMLEAERAYYQMLSAVNSAQRPLLDIKIADPTKPINVERIIVNAPSSSDAIKQYVQRDYVQPWLNVLSAAVPWFGAWGIVKAVADIPRTGDVTNVNASGSSQAQTGGTMSNATAPASPVVIVPPSYPPVP
jgi:hypothetical protein